MRFAGVLGRPANRARAALRQDRASSPRKLDTYSINSKLISCKSLIYSNTFHAPEVVQHRRQMLSHSSWHFHWILKESPLFVYPPIVSTDSIWIEYAPDTASRCLARSLAERLAECLARCPTGCLA